MGGGILRNAPNSLIWAVLIAFLGVLAASVVLGVTGSDSTDLWMFVSRITNLIGAVFGGGALIVAGAAAKSSAKAEQQTNGTLTAKEKRIAFLEQKVSDLDQAGGFGYPHTAAQCVNAQCPFHFGPAPK